jgi:hypothetical protein
LILVALVLSLGWGLIWWLMRNHGERLSALDQQIEALEKRHERED